MFSRFLCHDHEIPVTIQQAYMSLPQHIRKGVLIRRIGILRQIYTQQLIAKNFAKTK